MVFVCIMFVYNVYGVCDVCVYVYGVCVSMSFHVCEVRGKP